MKTRRFLNFPPLASWACLGLIMASPLALQAQEPAKTPAANAAPAGKSADKPAVAKPDPAPQGKTAAAEPAKKEGDAPKKEDKKDEAKPAEPALHKVKKGEFELKVTLDGVFESAGQTPISLSPEAWSDLTIVSVVDHGTEVKKGDVLVKFETKDLAEQIADLEKSQPLAELNLKLARQELETLEKTTPLSLDSARRTKMETEQDFAYYEDTGRPMDEKDAHEDLKRIEQSLSYAQEELDQLEKMYQADELTEETEEIILKRARNDVAYYKWILEQTKARSERSLNTMIPREHAARQRGV
ncbi:MAG: hypothetical protein KDM64_05895, partial [Verrucomicrobiae bacterium]|nr:hypothetical protein [Verrucomicrobiae bacterium]